MSDEADNLVLMLLREMRADVAQVRQDMATKGDLSDLHRDVAQGFAAVTSALTAIAHRLEDVDHGVRLADRLTAIEKRLNDLEGRRGS